MTLYRIGAVCAVLLALLLPASQRHTFAGEQAVQAQDKGASADAVKQWTKQVDDFRKSLEGGGNGRFQAVQLDKTSIFLVDTQQGHLWFWTFGEKGSLTAYQGRLFPGIQMGDIVGSSTARQAGPGSR